MEKNKLLLVVDLLRNLIFSKRCIDAQLARPSGISQHNLVVSSDANCALMLKASYVASLLIIFHLNSFAIDLNTFQKPKAIEFIQELNKDATFKPSIAHQADFYIFASLGLKKSHLKALIEDAKRFGGVVVIRGLKNTDHHGIKETLNF